MDDMIEQLKPRREKLTEQQSSTMLAAVVSAPQPRSRRRHLYVLTAACALIVGTAAATLGYRVLTEPGDGTRSPTASCVAQLRLDGVAYDGWTYLERARGPRAGLAELASCDDVGQASKESHNDPSRVEVWSLPPAEIDQAVAVIQGEGVTVYIAHGLNGEERRQVLRELGIDE